MFSVEFWIRVEGPMEEIGQVGRIDLRHRIVGHDAIDEEPGLVGKAV